MKMKGKNWDVGIPLDETHLVEVLFLRRPENSEPQLRKVKAITFTRYQWLMFRSAMDGLFN
jgi:hypothetical protein